MMEKKISSTHEDQKKQTQEAAEKAAKAGKVSRLMVQIKQKVGIAEWTKLDPTFESNIDKLISYHQIIFHMVDCIELQIQMNPQILAIREVASPPGENPWEMIGGWLHWMAITQFEGAQAKTLEKYSYACGKIAIKEKAMQVRTRTLLIKKMRSYTGDESEELNKSYEQLKYLLHGIDDTRHHLKSAPTTKEVKARGEAYHSMIRAFNEKGNEIQGWIDEVSMIVSLHQNELLKFAKELSMLHDNTFNSLNEVLLRLGYKTTKKAH